MNSSGIQVRRIREVTAGTLPATAMTITPFATWAVKSGMTRSTPENVNSDRQQDDSPAEDLQIAGSATCDYRIGIYDAMRAAAFCKEYTAAVSASSALIAAVAAGNKLTRAAGWGTRAVGDIVWVTGFVTNPAAFVAIVTAVSGGDLTLDTPHGALQDEAAGPTVTVADAGQLILGTSLLTDYWEEWNTKTSKGRKYPGVGVSMWSAEMAFPKPWKQSFNLVGMTAATRISAQLANASSSSALRKVVNSNVNFGDKTTVNSGMGFRYNGALSTDLRIETIKVSVENPLATSGGAGTLGPQDIDLDGDISVKLEITAKRKGTLIDTMLDDAANPDAEKAIGFGLVDAGGNRDYIYLEGCRPYNGDPDGLKKQGKETVSLSYTCIRKTTTHGAIRHARLV